PNYLSFQNNVMHLSRSGFGAGGYGGIWGTWDTNGIAYQPALPAPSFTDTGASPAFNTNLTNPVVHPTWGANIIVGGEYQTGDFYSPYGTMSQAQLNTYATNWPAGDSFPAGATMAARQAAIGLNSTTWACSGC